MGPQQPMHLQSPLSEVHAFAIVLPVLHRERISVRTLQRNAAFPHATNIEFYFTSSR